MTGYLGRLVDRAVGPAGPAVRPRLAPVFPLARPDRPGPPPLDGDVLPDPVVSPADPRVPRVDAAGPARVEHAPEIVETHPAARREEERPMPRAEPGSAESPAIRPEPLARQPAPAPAAEIRPTAEDAEESSPARPATRAAAERRPEQPRAIAQVRVERHDHVTVERARERQPQSRPPQIEVRIGRVEVRRPPEPEPFEWPGQAVAAAPPTASGFGELAAARRYVDRRWS